MKLQLALDTFTLEEALKQTEDLKEYVDIIEIGTPFVYEYGMEAVRKFREAFPEHEILADLKIMDAGALEAGEAFRAGADYATVLAVTDEATIQACVETANEFGKEMVADMMCVQNVPEKVAQLERQGMHGIAVHTGVDQQKRGRTPLEDLKELTELCNHAKISAVGGIASGTIESYTALKPEVIVVGGAIANAKDPKEEARLLSQAIHG